MLLHSANYNAQNHAHHSAVDGYHPAFEKKQSPHLLGWRTQRIEQRNVTAFVYHQHRKRTDDVARGNEQNECQNEERDPLFNLQNAIEIGLLLVAIFYGEIVS